MARILGPCPALDDKPTALRTRSAVEPCRLEATLGTFLLLSSEGSFRDEGANSVLSDETLRRCSAAVIAPALIGVVVDAMDLDISRAALAERASIKRRPGTAILELTVRDPSPDRALAIADSWGTAAQERLSSPDGDACDNGEAEALVTLTDPARLVED